LGSVTVTHPFHPLSGRRLPVLKRRVLDGVAMLQLQVEQDSVCMPESWTDRVSSAACLAHEESIPILAPEALRELLELVAALQPPDGAEHG
jgi:hypothetical protein